MRCELYRSLKEKLFEIEQLKISIKSTEELGKAAFSANSLIDVEDGYKAAEPHWLLLDELTDKKKILEDETKSLYKELESTAFDLSKFYSQPGYGLNEKKRVEVTLLDDTVLRGIIYPYVYDNVQQMYLRFDDGKEFDLDEGWEVKTVNFI